MTEKTVTLDQQLERNKRLHLEIQDDDLHSLYTENGNEYRNRIPLQHLDENIMYNFCLNDRIKSITWGLIITSVLGSFLAWGLTGAIIDQKSADLAFPYIFLTGGILFFLGPILAISYRNHRVQHIAIFNRHDGSPMLALRGDIPSPDSVQHFLKSVLERAKQLSDEIEEQALLSSERFNTASEIDKFHNLVEQGYLSHDEFINKKRSLIDSFLRE